MQGDARLPARLRGARLVRVRVRVRVRFRVRFRVSGRVRGRVRGRARVRDGVGLGLANPTPNQGPPGGCAARPAQAGCGGPPCSHAARRHPRRLRSLVRVRFRVRLGTG